MSPVGSQWMSPEEKASLAQAQEAKGPHAAGAGDQGKAKPTKKEPGLTPARVAEMLREAAASGDAAKAKKALELGASPNTRERSKPKLSVLEVAIGARRGDAVALMLLEAGGLCAPQDWGYGNQNDQNKDFANYAQTGAFKDPQVEAKVKESTMSSFLRMADSWQTLVRAKERLAPTAGLEELAASAARIGRWHMAQGAFEAGVGLEKAWKASETRHAGKSADPKGQGDRSALLALLKNPEAAKSATPKAVELYFRAAAAHDDTELLKALLGAGLRPSEDWSVPIDEAWDYQLRGALGRLGGPQRVSLISFAAATEGGAAFEALKKIPPAVAAAGRRVDPPWTLRDIPVGRLMELHGLGARIDGLDAEGGSILHVWASEDRAPRSGWATMAKEMPELFAKANKDGKTGAEIMAARLRTSAETEAFRASLARIESREIRREIPRETAKAAAPKRSRL